MTQLGGHPSSVLNKLQEQRELEEFCDVVLQVEENKFHAHRSVLAACSEYFHKMFTTDMIEKCSEVVVIHEVTADAMKNILTCIYTGKIELELDNIMEVLHATSMMQLNQIIDEITWHIKYKLLDAETACFFRDLAIRYSLDKLKFYVHQVFLNNFQEISKQSDFLDLDHEVIANILSSDDLVVKEEREVFEFLVDWIQKHVEVRRQQFPYLFKFVRLQFIPIKYIVNRIQNNALVREYHVCRDVVDEMMSYHISPKPNIAQKPRKSLVPKPDSAMLLPFGKMFQQIYIYGSNQSSDVIYDGLTFSSVMEHAAIATQHPVSVFCGGKTPLNEATGKAVRFDGVRWMDLPAMLEPRCGAAAVFFNDDVLVFGGETLLVSTTATFARGQSNPDFSNFSRTIDKFSDKWVSYETSIYPRSHFAAHVVNDRIYLIGGYKLTDANEPDPASVCNRGLNLPEFLCKYACKETLIFTPESHSLEKSGSLNEARTMFASTVAGSTIYVVGGVGGNNRNINSIETLETKQKKWVKVTISDNLGPCTAILDGSNRLKLWIFSQNQPAVYKYNFQSKSLTRCEEKNFKGVIIPFSLTHYIRPYIQVYGLTSNALTNHSNSSAEMYSFARPASRWNR